MKPSEVSFQHIRDYPWRKVWCSRHGWVPYFHECGMKAVRVAYPTTDEATK